MKHFLQLGLSLPGKGIIIAFLIPIVGLLPMFGEGLANAADAPFHAHRIYALSQLIEAGDLYPRWVPWFHLGYGYPIFNFYSPGATHIGAWLHLAGFSVVMAYNLTVALAWCAGSVGMYLLARSLLPASVALLACVLWVYAPSRFYEFWWQGSLAQIVATSLIPFAFYGVYRTLRAPNLRNSLWLAIPLALIVLSHTPTTYIVALFVLPASLISCLTADSRGDCWRRLVYFGIGFALALGLSLIFLLPALVELQYVRIGSELPDTVAFLAHRFVSPSEIVNFPQIIDPNDATLIMPRSLGLIGIVLSGLGVLALLNQRRSVLALLLLAGLAFGIFLTLEPSLDFWLTIPGFRNLRFPERVLRMAALFVALLGAYSVMLVPPRWRSIAVALVSALLIIQALPLMHPRDDDRIWDRITALDEIKMEFAEHNWGTTSYNEYLPNWGNGIPFDFPRDADAYVNNPLRIQVHVPDLARRSGRVRVRYLENNVIWIKIIGEKTEVRFRQFYFPGWRVTRNGEPFDFDADEEFGLISVRLPEGEHLLRLDYVGTSIQHLAVAITLISIAICIVIRWRATPPVPLFDAPPGTISTGGALLVLAGLASFAVFNTAWLQENVFRQKSDADSPANMVSRLDVTFDDTVTLLGYMLQANFISEQNPLGIRLYWRLTGEAKAEVRPIVQLVNLGVSETWAVSQPANFEGGKITGLRPDQFMSDLHRLSLIENVPAYVGRVSIQLAREDKSASIVKTSDGSDRVLLPEIVAIDASSPSFAGHSLAINFGSMLTLHCMETRVSTDRMEATLWWEVKQQPSADLNLFVHGVTEGERIVRQNDHPPLPGFYPTSLWRSGQHLQSEISLALDSSIAAVYIGLYNPRNGDRLPVSIGDARIERVVLPLENTTCDS